MLSDEEKKAIESLIEIREFANLSSYKDTKISQLNAIDVVLNLIEKQSKEIEELNKSNESKEQSSMKYYNLYKELVDKIKAKIEEYDDKEMTVNLVNRSAGKTFQQAVRNEVRKVLQSLLEKE